MKIYIAGPMSYIKAFNFPAFDAASAHLSSLGHEVISPAELDSPEFRERVIEADGTEPDLLGEWGNCLARDVKLISDEGVEAIALLPNWWKSRGATLEAVVGLLNGVKFFQYQADERDPLAPLSKASVLASIVKGFQTRWENKRQPALRSDGPTLKEWIAAGYKAEHYPPRGYAAKPETH